MVILPSEPRTFLLTALSQYGRILVELFRRTPWSEVMVGMAISVTGVVAQTIVPTDTTNAAIVPPAAHVLGLNEALATVSRRATPSVVSISIPMNAGDLRQLSLYQEYLRYYGEHSRADRLKAPRMIGSGVFLSDSGFIVTNNHVVDDGNADSIVVTTSDGESYLADLIGTDEFTDIAVLRIYGRGFPVPRLSNSDSLRVGTLVVAVGNPFGLSSTVTQGIVSALHRGELNSDEDGGTIRSFVQIDAAINPGNSGGGLFDIHGNLVGINTAIFSRTGDFAGYGFAIPSNIVKAVTNDLIEDGRIDRVSLGMEIADLNDSVAAANGLDIHRGVLVTSVDTLSSAQRAGIRVNDVIVAVRGRTVRSAADLQSVTVTNRIGDEVQLTLWRPEGRVDVVATLKSDSMKRNTAEINTSKSWDVVSKSTTKTKARRSTRSGSSGFLGITGAVLTDDVATRNGIAITDGLLITAVHPFGTAFKAGVLRGDVVVQINGRVVINPLELESEAWNRHAGEEIEIIVVRNGKRVSKLAVLQPGR